MRKIGVFLLLAIVLSLSGNALAQGDNSVYFVTYYSNNVSGAPNATVRFINDGDTGGNLWADIYVFDDSQELQACGSCPISADGLLSEDVKIELTNNPCTGRIPTRGVIKVISDRVGNPFAPSATTGLRGWATHIQKATSGYATTETPVADSNLASGEESLLASLCFFAIGAGPNGSGLCSGQGTVTCTQEDHDF